MSTTGQGSAMRKAQYLNLATELPGEEPTTNLFNLTMKQAAMKQEAIKQEPQEAQKPQEPQEPQGDGASSVPAKATLDTSKTNLIINYLPQTLTDDAFYALFAKIGQLTSHKVVRDLSSGYNFGYGFANYLHEADASSAIEKLNGLKLQNKTIKVAYARPKTDKTKKTNLYISGLWPSADEEHMRTLFSEFGNIVQARALLDNNTQQCTGAGFVLFSTTDECDQAIATMHRAVPEGYNKPINVKYSHLPSTNTVTHTLYATTGVQESHVGPVRNNMKAVKTRFSPMAKKEYGLITDPTLAERDELGVILFVRNIPVATEEAGVFELFSPFGTVRKVAIMRDLTGQSKGFGFVTMLSDSEAVKAVLKLNRSIFEGREIEVRFKLKKELEQGGDIGAQPDYRVPVANNHSDLRSQTPGSQNSVVSRHRQYWNEYYTEQDNRFRMVDQQPLPAPYSDNRRYTTPGAMSAQFQPSQAPVRDNYNQTSMSLPQPAPQFQQAPVNPVNQMVQNQIMSSMQQSYMRHSALENQDMANHPRRGVSEMANHPRRRVSAMSHQYAVTDPYQVDPYRVDPYQVDPYRVDPYADRNGSQNPPVYSGERQHPYAMRPAAAARAVMDRLTHREGLFDY